MRGLETHSIRDIAGRLLIRRLATLIVLFLIPATAGMFFTIRWRYSGFAEAEMSSFAERIDRKAGTLLSMNDERAQLMRSFVRLAPNGKLSSSQSKAFVLQALNNAILSGEGDVIGAMLCTGNDRVAGTLEPPRVGREMLVTSIKVMNQICDSRRKVGGRAGHIIFRSQDRIPLVAAVAEENLFFSSEGAHPRPVTSVAGMVLVTVHSASMFEDAWISTKFRLKQLGFSGSFNLATSSGEVPGFFKFVTNTPLSFVESEGGQHYIVSGNLFPHRMWSEMGIILFGLIALIGLALLVAVRATKRSLTLAFRSIDELNRDISRLGKESFDVPLLCEAPEEIASIRRSVEELRRRILAYGEELKRTESDRQIARTTQMVAHDVRKPMSMAQTLADLLKHAKSKLEIDNILRAELPNLQIAQRQVDAMLSDLNAIGSEVTLNRGEVSVHSLIELALGNMFRNQNFPSVSLSFEFEHVHRLNVDACKTVRVISNIIGNAVQAMNGTGNLWFRTTEFGKNCEIVIGNSGPSIDEEKCTRIFDAFYTTNQGSGGSGLGLAIAKKFVEAHLGSISCASFEGGVEFKFTLPVSEAIDDKSTVRVLSKSASAYFADVPNENPETDGGELGSLVEFLSDRPTPLRVLLLDDEPFYRRVIEKMIKRNPTLASVIDLREASSFSEAIVKNQRQTPHLVITDIDLGNSSHDGFDFVKYLRGNGFDGTICVHSNHFLQEDSKCAVDAGADVFLPKPMSFPHLIRILRMAADKLLVEGELKNGGKRDYV